MTIKHIYWFAYYNLDSPSVRYRGKFFLDELKRSHNIDFDFFYPSYKPMSILRFIYLYFSILFFRKDDSIIVIQRVQSNWVYSNALKFLIYFRKKNTVYDLDDADYVRHPDKILNYFLQHCSCCFIGSRELAKYAKKFNDNVLHLTSPTIDYQNQKSKRNPIINIGWIGCYGGGHKESLFNSVFPAIKQLKFDLTLSVLGITKEAEKKELEIYFQDNHNVKLNIPDNIDWQNETEIQRRVLEFDVGIASLIDDEVHRSKSAFKLKQYFTCGLPALSSFIGENKYFLKDELNGFFCKNQSDFKNRIAQIKAMSDDEYKNLCKNARDSIKDFSIERNYKLMHQYFASRN